MTSRYLAGKAGVYSDLTLEDAYDIHHTPDTCGYCGKERGPNDGKRAFHIDHIIPMVQGGPNSRWNLVKVCASCNSSKGSASLADFHSRTASLTDDRYDAIIANMAAMSGKSTEQVNGLLTQSHEFEQAHQRERARLMALLVS
ncbi:HNH endonuclease [Paenibacillus sp. J5C_2022]|uniref:HNH endonuclease n=1 Tax=Paenibacillus sp. J5C2022 TaxID=2977129 RepID=UPI0021D3BD52|nr:HNH endonuclease signature motif containing protein [Paenibacillus sp. J5C2022]MCU6709339.1 HNH endonuclease [Paenibacillus sp. J5C2022]